MDTSSKVCCCKVGWSELILIEIDYIMNLLNCENSIEDQESGINLAKQVECINVFIEPKYPYNEKIWKNCAKILMEKKDEELAAHIYDLLHWIDDLERPGSLYILTRLKKYKKNSTFERYLQQCLNEAKASQNKEWEKILYEIKAETETTSIDIDFILESLDCNKPSDTQVKGILMADEVENFKIFISPQNNNIWENCAKILNKKHDNELLDYLFELCEWLKYPSCPKTIFNRLKKMKRCNRTETVLNICIKKAASTNNSQWEHLLCEVKKSLPNNTKKSKFVVNIDYAFGLMSEEFNSSQEKGIQIAKKIKCINAFIQPYRPFSKEVWENCAKIIYSKSDRDIEEYLPKLLEWLQDLNWPGALIILERINNFQNTDILNLRIKQSIMKAKIIKDEEWLANLLSIKSIN